MPPDSESNYPRVTIELLYGTADRMEALGKSYFGLTWVFVLNFLLSIGFREVYDQFRPYALLAMVTMVFISGVASYFPAMQAGVGLGWPTPLSITVAVVLGANSIFCCGAVVILILQMMVASELQRYGLTVAFRGFRSAWLREAVRRRRDLEAEQALVPANQVSPWAPPRSET